MSTQWIDPSEKLPFPYDLVTVQTKRGTFNGWWSGSHWRGLRIKPSDTINGWKRCYQGND